MLWRSSVVVGYRTLWRICVAAGFERLSFLSWRPCSQLTAPLKLAKTQVHCVLITNTESCWGDRLNHGASAAANSLQRAEGSCRGCGASDFRGLKGGVFPSPSCSRPFWKHRVLAPFRGGLGSLLSVLAWQC